MYACLIPNNSVAVCLYAQVGMQNLNQLLNMCIETMHRVRMFLKIVYFQWLTEISHRQILLVDHIRETLIINFVQKPKPGSSIHVSYMDNSYFFRIVSNEKNIS
uniref:Uncharacterized protein n=1 Tax=Aplanochytrium stocchinoi TaxID=215587 RepID=A0A7S3PTL2_9STRA